MATLWPDHDAHSARKLLNQSVYVLRRTLGDGCIISDFDELRLDTTIVAVDVVAFRAAIARGEDERAVELYRGAFLEAFFVTASAEFEDWASRERNQLALMYAKALERLADAAEAAGDLGSAADWWRVRVAHDPCDSSAVLRLMLTLEALGNRAGALTQARIHEQLLRNDFDMQLPSELKALVNRLHSSPPLAEQPSATPPYTPASDLGDLPPDTARQRDAPPPSRTAESRSTRHVALAMLGLVCVMAGVIWAGADRIWPKIAPEETARGTSNIAAFEHYLRGSDSALLRSDSGVHAGIEHFRNAVALDPDYSAAWAGLAKMYGRAAASAARTERDRYYALGLQAAERALSLDDSLAEAHATLGILLMGTFDFVSAERHLSRALALDPEHFNTHEWLVTLYVWTQRPEQALAHARRGLELEPLSPRATAELARALAASDRCPEALEQLDKLELVRPPLLRAFSIAALCHARLQQWDTAIAIVRAAPADAYRSSAGLLGLLLGLAGRQQEALLQREKVLQQWSHGDVDAYAVALQFVGSGRLDEAYEWLNRALDDRSLSGLPGDFAHTQVVGPLFAHVQADPRFSDLQMRMGATPGPRTR